MLSVKEHKEEDKLGQKCKKINVYLRQLKEYISQGFINVSMLHDSPVCTSTLQLKPALIYSKLILEVILHVYRNSYWNMNADVISACCWNVTDMFAAIFHSNHSTLLGAKSTQDSYRPYIRSWNMNKLDSSLKSWRQWRTSFSKYSMLLWTSPDHRTHVSQRAFRKWKRKKVLS